MERERTNRKATDDLLHEEREQHVTDLRRQDEELRSNNAGLREAELAMRQGMAALAEQLLHARELGDVATPQSSCYMLGAEWWGGLRADEQLAICRVWAATCNAHRWVNVGKGFDEGIKEAWDAIRAARQAETAAGGGAVAGAAAGAAETVGAAETAGAAAAPLPPLSAPPPFADKGGSPYSVNRGGVRW